MKISYQWLQEYIDAPLPAPETIADVLTMRSFEVESVEKKDNDTIFEIAILPNRSHDCLSYIGIAREVATLFNLEEKPPSFEYGGNPKVKTADAVMLLPPDRNLVRRALKRLAVDVKVGESPAWLKERLAAHGQRSINNIVDATNFVMLETGQPVHAFDYDTIAGDSAKEIIIRCAHDGEVVETLDAQRYTLTPNMLVIADSEKALDIAGIKGGAISGITQKTTRVLLSACTFNPVLIRKTSRKLNLFTDASKRFEQDLSPVLAERGMGRLSALIADIAGGKVAADVIDFYPRKRNAYAIGVSVSEVNALLGTSLKAKEIETILDRLTFDWKRLYPQKEITHRAKELVEAPYKYAASISYDAPQAFDCSSFIAYVHACVGIAIPRITVDQYVFGEALEEKDLMAGDVIFAERHDPEEVHTFERIVDGKKVIQHVQQTEIRELLASSVNADLSHNGIYLGDGKVIHASGLWHKGNVVIEDLKETPAFKNIRGYRRFWNDEERYVVKVPPERLDLHAGPGFMISGNSADLIEEIGRVYGYENIAPQEPSVLSSPSLHKTFYYTNKIRDILVGLGFSEVMTYAFQNEGEVEMQNPLAEDKKYLRSNLYAGLVNAREFNKRNKPLFGVDSIKIFEIGTVFRENEEYYELGIVAEKDADVEAGFKHISDALDQPLPHKNGCINLTEYIAQLPSPNTLDSLVPIDVAVRFVPVSLYPFVLRDIAVWTPEEVTGLEVQKLISLNAGELLVRADQFDSFSKDGRTSYAYHLVFQSDDRTLTDAEVNEIMERVTRVLHSRDAWEVR